jgi:hypothetical protein
MHARSWSLGQTLWYPSHAARLRHHGWLASWLATGRYLGGQTVWFLSDFVAKILPALAKQLPDEKFKLVRP